MYKITAPIRFTIFIFIISALLTLSIEFLVREMFAPADALANYQWVETVVDEGETFWQIQSERTPNANISQLVCWVEEKNERKMGYLQAGEKIFVLEELPK